MVTKPVPHKIRASHLERQAVIYIRQSTPMQVRENTGSTTRQYDLARKALNLGWDQTNIRIIDQDQAQSGASSRGRDGFQMLVAEVSLQHVGAVFCLEASRLARANSDWYRLLEICALTDTLVIDEDGVYDPSQYNDRLLLGFKGTMSEAELHWLHQRLLGGKLAKAQQGQLRFRLPTGLVYDPSQQVVLDPDEEVQATIRLVFNRFDQYHSAMKVVTHFAQHRLRFPTRHWGGARAGELSWGPLSHARVLSILHNPAYAGAYVYGRTHTRTRLLPGEAPLIKGRTRQIQQKDWQVIIQNAHPGYLSWQQFLRNQKQLDSNRTWRFEDRQGAVREGRALLQGIVICGVCGRRMSVRYRADGVSQYECRQAHTQRGEKTCQTMRGDGIDAAVASSFLAAIQPAQLDVSLAAIDQIERRAQQVEKQRHLHLERVRYEAQLARRRFMSVEPENRLVARSLERDWNQKLAEVAHLEQDHAALAPQMGYPINPEERQRILALAQDLPTLWQATTTSNTQRKQLLRFLVKDVTLAKREQDIHIGIRWQTGALTELSIERPKTAAEACKTDIQVVDRIRELAPTHPDLQIVQHLNQEGFIPGRGGSFTVSKVRWLRYKHRIETGCPENPLTVTSEPRGDGRYSARATAEILNVNVSTIATWCEAGRLDSIRAGSRSPRWIKLAPEDIAQLRKPTCQRWSKYSSL